MRVAALHIAPVKGLGVVRRDSVDIGADGVAGDRRFFLLDADGEVATLRRHPRLAAVLPAWDGASELTLALPDGGGEVRGEIALGADVEARLFGKQRAGRLVDGPFAEALSELAGAPLRLALGPPGVGWDEGPVTVVSAASLDSMDEPDRRRFRMTIEVEGVAEPFGEDAWVGGAIDVGEARLDVLSPLERCVVITRSPDSGVTDWEGLRDLARRRGKELVCLGLICGVARPGRVAVGDPVVPSDR